MNPLFQSLLGPLPLLLGSCLFLIPTMSQAEDVEAIAQESEEHVALAGHSYHGEAFNEGPRQAATLVDGMSKIRFPTSAESEATQAFIEQGISQLHGFLYLEAERSFRQAAQLEPELAIAYWGMAMANHNNAKRARGFIAEAKEHCQENTTAREQMYVDAFHRFLTASPAAKDDGKEDDGKEDEKQGDQAAEKQVDEKRNRAFRLISDLEKILHAYPDDIEARAQVALQLWLSERRGIKIASRYAVDALLGEIFAEQPMHPAHHYRIHLWDSQRPENALESSAKCGPSMPAVAHMWHMPGHIYSRLHRYGDAAWQQEASARVDHAHMMRSRLMPDQIHNFAHNNEWLIRNLLFLGRVEDALDQAKNLVSLPRHPAYNSMDKRGSYKFGRMRLMQTLTEYELWDQLVDEAGGPYFPPTKKAEDQEDWLGWLAVAHYRSGHPERGAKTLRSLKRRSLKLQSQLLDLADGSVKSTNKSDDDSAESDDDSADKDHPTREQIRTHLDELKKVIARAAAVAATHRKDVDALTRLAKTANLDQVMLASWMAAAGDLDEAIKIAEKAVKKGTNQVRPLAVLVDLQWRSGDQEAALKSFRALRKLAAHADLETPLLARLQPVANAAKCTGDWRIAAEPADDLGDRPPLDQLGPFRWEPYEAAPWNAKLADDTPVHSSEFDGRPRLVIFYLGFGCLHCVEQLQAFAPRLGDFAAAGIDMLGISTETPQQLLLGLEAYEQPIAIPLLADPEHTVFNQFRCWDDFEDQPLHGTFLIDASGRVRWQDISHEPFTDVDFLLEESKRLLELP